MWKSSTAKDSIPYTTPRVRFALHKNQVFEISDVSAETFKMSFEEDGEGAGISVTPESDREVTRLWHAWRTVNEMCADRVRLLVSQTILTSG